MLLGWLLAGGNLNLIQWAQSPWGQQVPTHISWTLLWVSAIGALAFLIVHALYVSIWAKPAAAHSATSSGLAFQRGRGANSRARSAAQSQRAAVSRDHGVVHACPAVHRVSPQRWASSLRGSLITGSRESFYRFPSSIIFLMRSSVRTSGPFGRTGKTSRTQDEE